MNTTFEPCLFFDLTALHSDDEEQHAMPHVTENCAGKTLLMVGANGFEVLHVPAVLH